jgi:hypothetical protein
LGKSLQHAGLSLDAARSNNHSFSLAHLGSFSKPRNIATNDFWSRDIFSLGWRGILPLVCHVAQLVWLWKWQLWIDRKNERYLLFGRNYWQWLYELWEGWV